VSGPPETSPGAAPGQPTAPADARFRPDGGDGLFGTPGAAAGPYPAPAGGFGVPVTYERREPRQRVWPPRKAEWVTAAVVIGALAVVGAAVAPLWVHLAPRLAFRVDQPGRALPVIPEAEEYIGADGRFVFITLVVGLLAGLACWLVRRSRGPLVLLALAVGTGYQPADLQHVGRIVYQPLTLRAKSALVVEPVAAVLAYLLGVGFAARNDLGQNRGTSSGSG
jgi:hypothetical protein